MWHVITPTPGDQFSIKSGHLIELKDVDNIHYAIYKGQGIFTFIESSSSPTSSDTDHTMLFEYTSSYSKEETTKFKVSPQQFEINFEYIKKD